MIHTIATQHLLRFMLITLGSLILLVVTACGSPDPDTEATSGGDLVPRIALPVQVIRATAGTITDTIEVQARLSASRHRDVVILAPGIVSQLPVVDGQLVSSGEVLLQLDPLPEDVDAVERAENDLARAERSLKRLQALQERVSGAVATADIDAAQDAVDDAQLSLAEAQRDADNRRIVSPFDGVISGVDAVLGQRLNSGAVFARLHDLSSYTTAVRVPETLVPRLTVGLPVAVIPLGAETGIGRILTLPAAIDRDSGTGLVQVRVDDPPPSWRPGAFALMRIASDEVSAPVVLPRSCVLYQRNRAYVWEVYAADDSAEDDLANEDDAQWLVRRVWLTLGSGDEDQVAVVEGLSAGAIVVRDGSAGLGDGVPVLPQGLDDLGPPSVDEQKAEDARAQTGSGRGRGRAAEAEGGE